MVRPNGCFFLLGFSLVARSKTELRHFVLGRILGSRLVAAMELAHHWR